MIIRPEAEADLVNARDWYERQRAADKDDIAEQVVAFCRTDSITGQTLAIDAGRFFH